MKASQHFVAGLLTLVILLASCGGGNSSAPPPPRIVITVSPSVIPYGIVGQPYPGAQLQASGGTAPYTFTSANLPTGITLSTDGKIAGTTPNSGPVTFPIIVTVHDAVGNSGIATLNLDTHLPLDIFLSNKEAPSGYAYQGSIVVSMQENNLTATVAITDGSLPPGLALGAVTTQGPNPGVAITGTPSQNGIFAFTAQAKDSLSPPRTAQVVLKMYIGLQQLQFFTTSLSNGIRGQAYQYLVPLRGGTLPLTCSLAPGSGPMPAGLTVGAGCAVSGTPTVTGDFSFTLRATDSGSGSQQQTTDQLFTMKVLEPLKVTGNMPDGTTGETYLGTVSISGGTPPYYLQRMDSDCCFVLERHDLSIHGVPHLAGQRYITVYASDSNGQYIGQSFTINIQAGPFQQGGENLPRMKIGNNYQGMLTAVSGQRPLTWTFISGTLPPGIGTFSTNDSLMFSGVATSAGVYPLNLQVADSASPPKTFTIPMNLQVYDKLPRNDSTVDADFAPENNGFLNGSVSPFADPVDLANPDQDYYHFRGFAGETYTFTVNHTYGPLDPTMEIVDANGQKFATCRNPGDDVPDINGNVDPTPLAFDDVCVNDDVIPGSNIDSQLTFRVPGASGSLVDFYVHIADFRGDARPDMGYYFYFGKFFNSGVIP